MVAVPVSTYHHPADLPYNPAYDAPLVSDQVAGGTVVPVAEMQRALGKFTFDVWVAWTHRRNKHGISGASNVGIAAKLNCSERRLKKANQRLRKFGLLSSSGWIEDYLDDNAKPNSTGRAAYIHHVYGEYRRWVVRVPSDVAREIDVAPGWGGRRKGAGRPAGKPAIQPVQPPLLNPNPPLDCQPDSAHLADNSSGPQVDSSGPRGAIQVGTHINKRIQKGSFACVSKETQAQSPQSGDHPVSFLEESPRGNQQATAQPPPSASPSPQPSHHRNQLQHNRMMKTPNNHQDRTNDFLPPLDQFRALFPPTLIGFDLRMANYVLENPHDAIDPDIEQFAKWGIDLKALAAARRRGIQHTIDQIVPPRPHIKPARNPRAPMIDSSKPEREQVMQLVRAYRGAVESRFKNSADEKLHSCYVFFRTDVRRSKHYPALVKATKFLIENKIPPAAWAAWSADVWRHAQHKLSHKHPPITWVFGIGRLESRQGWYDNDDEESNCGSSRVYYGEQAKDCSMRWQAITNAIRRERAFIGDDKQSIIDIVNTYFPGGYKQWYAAAQVECDDIQHTLNEMVARGKFVW